MMTGGGCVRRTGRADTDPEWPTISRYAMSSAFHFVGASMWLQAIVCSSRMSGASHRAPPMTNALT